MQCKAQLKCPVALFNIGDSKSEPFAWCGQQATHVANGPWSTLFTKEWQIQNTDTNVRKEKYIYAKKLIYVR